MYATKPRAVLFASAGWLAGYVKGYNDPSEEMRNEEAMKERRRQEWIPCPLCGQQKKRGGMRQHI